MGNASIKMEDGSEVPADPFRSTNVREEAAERSGKSRKVSEKAAPDQNTDPTPELSPSSSENAISRASSKRQVQSRTAVTVPVEQKSVDEEEESVDDFDILVQFIPYYGQGDPSNDILVRSTLMNLMDDDIEKVDVYGNTLLMLACQYKLPDLVRILLNKGADANAKNHSGAYCIHFPCYKDTQSLQIAKMLLQAGANPEVAEASYGCTPLHYCASGGNVEFCKLLIQFGSFVGTRDFYDYTAVDYAREAGMQEAAAFLQKKLLALTNNGAPGLIARGVSQRGGFVFDNLKAETPTCDVFIEDEWASSVDPASGARYFVNSKSGECLWEADFDFLKLQKMLASPKRKDSNPPTRANATAQPESVYDIVTDTSTSSLDKKTPDSPATPMQLARANTLRGFGRSAKDLLRKASKPEMMERAENQPPGLDSATVQKLISEAQLQATKILEDERAAYREQLAERDGKLAKLEYEAESLAASKNSLEKEVNTLKDNLNSNMTDSEVLKSISADLAREKEEVVALKFNLAASKTQFAQNLSRAETLAEEAKRQAKEAEDRAAEAHATMKSLEKEVIEGREFKQMNAQLMRDLHKEQVIRKKLHNEIEDMKGKIRVYVRVRPFSKSEQERGCSEVVIKDSKLSICVNAPDGKKTFDFDSCFGGKMADHNSQADIFADTKNLMTSVIDGYNVCIFAYGQTGSGKTFTMIGAADIASCISPDGEFDDLAGIAPRAVSEIFRLLNEKNAQITYEVEIQMFQLYRDGLEDLLADKKKAKNDTKDMKKQDAPLKITLSEHSPTGLVQVQGANVMTATTPIEVMQIFALGSKRRTVASTQMNAESSRSHLIFSVTVKMVNRRTESTVLGKLTLVDLAGSERVDKSGAEGEMLKEAQSINKSLSALGDVIASLTSSATHVPYRNHPLTMLMSDSIGGNAKTLMFVNCSPADYNVPETLNSLGFAKRCKDVTNTGGPGANSQQINALKKELAKLKKGGKPAQAGNQKLSRPG